MKGLYNRSTSGNVIIVNRRSGEVINYILNSNPYMKKGRRSDIAFSFTLRRAGREKIAVLQRKFLLGGCGILAGFLLSGCAQKDLEYFGETREILIKYDLKNVPDANPDGMTLFFYPLEEGGGRWRYDIPGAKGGRTEIQTGR